MLSGCFVDSQCQSSADCQSGEVCIEGDCRFECRVNDDCAIDYECLNHRCYFSEGCIGCSYPEAPQATARCEHGLCEILSCDENWVDANEDPRDGCECTPTNGGEEILDTLDNDCDGLTDEGFDCVETNNGVEICDGKDNDCNGKIDDGLVCCPDDMTVVDDLFCIDRYEASRPDATEISIGVDESQASSRPGVLPWTYISVDDAQQACQNAGKRLCHPGEWLTACEGSAGMTYTYGNDYDNQICNGIDAFCEDPEPDCNYSTTETRYRLMTTASFSDCVSECGAFDINGNVWEWDATTDDDGELIGRARGGAFNCLNSRKQHECTYANYRFYGVEQTNVGFRCCK